MVQLSFETAVRQQPAALSQALPVIADSLTASGFDVRAADQSLLLGGIGASYAALATPLYRLRADGRVAHRSSCGDMPASATPLADIYLAVSQSGRSRETVQLLQRVPRSRRVALVNRAPSPLADVSDLVLSVGDTDDSPMSSIAFTATMVALGLMADALAGRREPMWSELPDLLDHWCTDRFDELIDFAADTADSTGFDVVAGAAELSAAEQGALLFREGPRLPATGTDTRSYLHGPMDCAGGGTAHILIGREREAALAEQLAEKSVPILLITDRDITTPAARVLHIPPLPEVPRAIVATVVLQRLVLAVATARGIDVEARAFTRVDTKVDSPDEALAVDAGR